MQAEPDGNRVRISWEPSAAAAGSVHYLVARGRGQEPRSPAQGVTVVTGTERCDATDDEAPAGTDLFYSVFAARGAAWSRPAVAGLAVFTPDVADVSVSYADTSVAASWRPYPGTDTVHVVRREGRQPRGPDDGTEVEASLTGFADTGLRSGTEYWYLIVASYAVDGGRLHAAGVPARAVPSRRRGRSPTWKSPSQAMTRPPSSPNGRPRRTDGSGWYGATSRCAGGKAPRSARQRPRP